MLGHCANGNDVYSREVTVRVSGMRDTIYVPHIIINDNAMILRVNEIMLSVR